MNKLVLNVKKTKVMLIGSVRKKQILHFLQLMVNGTMTEQIDETRLLGVQLKVICLGHHTYLVYVRSWFRLLILRQVTHAVIVSQMNDCAAVWGNAGVGEISRLQAAQNKAARIILRCSNDTPIEEQYKQLEWSYIRDIIARNVLQLFSNLLVKKKPKLLISRFREVKDRHLVSTRAASTSDYVSPRTRLVTGKRMFCF